MMAIETREMGEFKTPYNLSILLVRISAALAASTS